MNKICLLVLYNHTKGVYHVPYFDKDALSCRFFARDEYGFPDSFLGDKSSAFGFGEHVYKYENAEGDDLEAVIYEIPGESVKNMLGDLITHDSWIPV